MTRFSIRDLLLATTLVALGVGTLAMPWGLAKLLPLPLVGAGLFTPFGRWRTGALYGLLLSLSFIAFTLIVRELGPGFKQR